MLAKYICQLKAQKRHHSLRKSLKPSQLEIHLSLRLKVGIIVQDTKVAAPKDQGNKPKPSKPNNKRSTILVKPQPHFECFEILFGLLPHYPKDLGCMLTYKESGCHIIKGSKSKMKSKLHIHKVETLRLANNTSCLLCLLPILFLALFLPKP